MEDIVSASDSEDEMEDEAWQPEKQERRRASRRPKTTGVSRRRRRTKLYSHRATTTLEGFRPAVIGSEPNTAEGGLDLTYAAFPPHM